MPKTQVTISIVLFIVSAFLIVAGLKHNRLGQGGGTIEDEEIIMDKTTATIQTDKGVIRLELNVDKAPKTVENFTKKAKEGFYNDLIFHRVEDWVIQGGDPKGDGTGGGEMETELSDLEFNEGSLGVARGGDINISNDSQFFITKEPALHLNKQYTNFGQVIEGMEVVKTIEIGDKIISIDIQNL